MLPEPIVGGAKRLPGLDGFRGLAILLVLFGHLRFIGVGSCRLDRMAFAILDEAWIGVDLFFVLSGFLITRILLDTKRSAHYWITFYARRTLRIFPLYYGSLFLFLIVFPTVPVLRDIYNHEQEIAPGIPHSQLWFWLYASNILFAIKGEGVRLGATWSLAVEEQFYLLWPMAVAWLSRKRLVLLCIGLEVLSLLLRTGASSLAISYPATYMLTPTHMDGLLAGAVLAAYADEPSAFAILTRWARIVAVVSTALFIMLVALARLKGQGVRNDLFTQVPLYSISACCAGSVMLFAMSGGCVSELLSTRFLRRFGKYSYSMYLFHRPLGAAILHLTRLDRRPIIGGSHLPAMLIHYTICVSILYVVSFISWHVYEKQFLKLQRFFPTHAVTHQSDAKTAGAARILQRVA